MMRWTEAQLAVHLARRSPAVPRAHARIPPKIGRQTHLAISENTIHEAVTAHLRTRAARGIHWHHPATGELRDPATAAKLQRMGVRAGLPDLLILIDGRLHGLELKRERGGYLSADQRAMHDELRAAGAVIETARGLDEALGVLEQWGALLPTNKGTIS